MLALLMGQADALSGFTSLPINLVLGLMGGAVGYGMFKGKVDANEKHIGLVEKGMEKQQDEISKRLDRIERTLDDMQRDLRAARR